LGCEWQIAYEVVLKLILADDLEFQNAPFAFTTSVDKYARAHTWVRPTIFLSRENKKVYEK
jgi:hypothetical protein